MESCSVPRPMGDDPSTDHETVGVDDVALGEYVGLTRACGENSKKLDELPASFERRVTHFEHGAFSG